MRLGKDVTAEFPEALRVDFKVFRGELGYSVADADEPGSPLPNGFGLPTPQRVRRYIASYLSNGGNSGARIRPDLYRRGIRPRTTGRG